MSLTQSLAACFFFVNVISRPHFDCNVLLVLACVLSPTCVNHAGASAQAPAACILIKDSNLHHEDLSLRRQFSQFKRLPLAIQLLLGTQMMFNVGFYVVVPFLAVYMSQDLRAGGAMIGLVLGVRTFSQQGMFFVGGALTDRLGVRRMLLTGMLIRVAGFLVAGFSSSITTLMIGVILIGFAAALFSPAAEAALAYSATTMQLPMSRSQLFALDNLCGRMGALIGPVLGALLIPFGFTLVSVVGAIIFVLLFLTHYFIIPPIETPRNANVLAGFGHVVRNKLFLVFALGYSGMLVAYNQQYLSLPTELQRATGSDDALGWMFVLASAYNVLLQMQLVHLSSKWKRTTSLWVGFGAMALGFAILAVAAPLQPWSGVWALVPAVAMLLFLHFGQMVAAPYARDLVGLIAREQHLGTYFGVLNSFGGFAVLITSVFIGRTLDFADEPQPAAMTPWLILVVLMLGSAALTTAVARRVRDMEAA